MVNDLENAQPFQFNELYLLFRRVGICRFFTCQMIQYVIRMPLMLEDVCHDFNLKLCQDRRIMSILGDGTLKSIFHFMNKLLRTRMS